MFLKGKCDFKTNIFKDLAKSVPFEDITKGRRGAVIVDPNNDSKDVLIPIVRTTTNYAKPALNFSKIHHDLIDAIRTAIKCPELTFNNAMVEIYDSNYRKMKYHSDQALDLVDGSFICLFSCYDKENPTNVRKLKTKEKPIVADGKQSKEGSDIVLDHNSIVLFSTGTNKKWLHKIVMDEKKLSDDLWLGVTLRLSGTFIVFVDHKAYLCSSKVVLTFATPEEKKAFAKHKSLENATSDYKYPMISYTVSASDLLPP